jgi:sugar phosphate isomerase/epimerase
MQRSLALHQTTVLQCSPLELVSIAFEVGCDGVCVFVHTPNKPGPGRPAFPRVTRDMLPEMLARMRDTGIAVTNLEYFPLTADVRLDEFRPALDLGAALGARRAVVHLHDTDDQRGTDKLSHFAGLAAEYGLAAGLEFMGLSAGCPSLARAVQLVERVGLDNLGVAVDPLHLQRTGAVPGDLAGLRRNLLSYVQLCDGPARVDPGLELDPARYVAEAFDRLVPGEGAFPLVQLMQVLSTDLPVDVEVPSLRLAGSGISPLEHARHAIRGARRVIVAATDENNVGLTTFRRNAND